jgi:hypothetical protein
MMFFDPAEMTVRTGTSGLCAARADRRMSILSSPASGDEKPPEAGRENSFECRECDRFRHAGQIDTEPDCFMGRVARVVEI